MGPPRRLGCESRPLSFMRVDLARIIHARIHQAALAATSSSASADAMASARLALDIQGDRRLPNQR